MKFTNRDNLIQPVFSAVTKDNYSKGGADISVTELIDSPRIRVLKRKYQDDLETDASDLLAAHIGSCAHKSFEDATSEGVAERRLSASFSGWKISGGMDYFHEGVVIDYKVTNVFKCVYASKGRIQAFEDQLNCYAHILRENGIEVKALKVFAVFLDWRRNEYKKAYKDGKLWIPNVMSGWPEKKAMLFEVNMWPEELAKKYFESKVLEHQRAEKELPLCSQEDIWRGNRCADYCQVSKWCDQWQKMKTTGISS